MARLHPEYARVKRAVIVAIEAAAWQDLYADNHDRFDQALDDLLERAKELGDVRGDVDATDVILLLGALTYAATRVETRARRALAIILQGLRAADTQSSAPW